MQHHAGRDWLERLDGTLDCFLPHGLHCVLEPPSGDRVVWWTLTPIRMADRTGDALSVPQAASLALGEADKVLSLLAARDENQGMVS